MDLVSFRPASMASRPRSRVLRQPDGMLLVLPVPFRLHGGAVLLEEQACNGLLRWAENFSHVTLAAPTLPEHLLQTVPASTWRSARELPGPERFTFLPLPWGYGVRPFLQHLPRVTRLLREHIDANAYLQFGIGYLVGDWAAVAALLAIALRRPFAIHTDRVEHQVLVEVARAASPWRRARTGAIAHALRRYHRFIIERCALGLWHGADCFDEYGQWCSESHLIHDVHYSTAHRITRGDLDLKLSDARSSALLRICYAGRLEAMKAPLEWLRAIAVARDQGANVEAVWYGDGSLKSDAAREAERLNLGGIVSFPGLIRNRNEMLQAIRKAHVFAFTHVTRESPRCLLEALISGTPIVGYESRFASEITHPFGGGLFSPLHDPEALGRQLATLAADRERLGCLIRDAARSGERFSDSAVFEERSRLIKQHCGTRAKRSGPGAATLASG